MDKQPAVLYVEDHPQSRKLMSILLKGRMKLPHVTIFEDSQNFLEQVNNLDPKPDVIFLDIHVQPYSGFEMLAMLRELGWTKEVPIVALTASVMNEEVQQLKTVGFSGCLSKPLDVNTFPDILERIMHGEKVWRTF
jgi:CheY-like chemotaxis protein